MCLQAACRPTQRRPLTRIRTNETRRSGLAAYCAVEQEGHGFSKTLETEWFLEERFTFPQRTGVHQSIDMPGHIQHQEIRTLNPDLAHHLIAAESRHVQVGKEEVEFRWPVERGDAFEPTPCLGYDVALPLERSALDCANGRFVINQENHGGRVFGRWCLRHYGLCGVSACRCVRSVWATCRI